MGKGWEKLVDLPGTAWVVPGESAIFEGAISRGVTVQTTLSLLYAG